jgi:hypothetical protein
MPLTDDQLIAVVKDKYPDLKNIHVLGDNVIGTNDLKQTHVCGKDIAEAYAKDKGLFQPEPTKPEPSKHEPVKPTGITSNPTGAKS